MIWASAQGLGTQQAVKAQTSLRMCTDSPGLSLLAYTKKNVDDGSDI